MRRKSRLPKSPVTGSVHTIMVRGSPVSFRATGLQGFGKWKVVKKHET